MPWACVSDFNRILTHDEKEGGNQPNFSLVEGFRDALHTCDLIVSKFKLHGQTRKTKKKRGKKGRYHPSKARLLYGEYV